MRKINWQVKLIAAFTLILIVSLLFQLCYVLPQIRDYETSHAEKYITQAAKTIAYEMSPQIEEIRTMVPAMLRRREFRTMNADQIRQTMEQPPEQWSCLQEVFLFNPEGEAVYPETADLPWQAPKAVKEDMVFAVPMIKGETHMAPPRYEPDTRTVNMMVGTPIRTRGRGVIGVLIGQLRLNELMQTVAEYPLDPGYKAYVLLPNGTVIAYVGTDLFALEGGPLSLHALDLMLDDQDAAANQGKTVTYDRNGERGMRAALPLRFNDWRIVVEAPMQAIMATSKDLSQKLLLANIGFFGLALAISVLFSRRIADQRDRAEAVLRVREERFREMFHSMSTGGQILKALPDGSDFIIQDINRAAAGIARKPIQELIGKRYTTVFPEHAKLESFKRIQETWKTGRPARASAILHVDGLLEGWEEYYIYKLPAGEVVLLIDDVTEQKIAADALEAAETKYRELVQSANSIIIRVSAEGNITFINEFAQEFFGFSEEEILGRHVIGTILEDREYRGENPRVGLAYDMAVPERYTGNETLNIRRNGEGVWVAWTNRAVLGPDGEVLEYFCVGTDIDERKRAENNLRTRLRYEEGLAACSRTLLTQSQDSLEQTLQHLLKAADVSRVCLFKNIELPAEGLSMLQEIEVCAQDVPPSISYPNPPPYAYKEGMMRWIEALRSNKPIVGLVEDFPQSERNLLEPQKVLSVLSIPVWVSGALYGFIGFDHTTERRVWHDSDILLLRTAADMLGIYLEHRRTEAALRESELRYRAIFEQSAAAIMLVDAETGDVVEANDKAHDLLGRPSGDRAALRMAHLDGSNEEADVAKHMATVIARGERLSESRLRTKDGQLRDVLLDCRALKVDGHNMLQTVWFDISDRKQAERELEKSHEGLRELTTRLQEIREEESSRISREIHDELGQGLTGLNLNLAWLHKHLPAVCHPQRIAQITEKVDLMTALVNQAIRKIQQIATDLRPSALDLGLIEAVEWEVEQFREQSGLVCDLSIMGPNVVLGDASSIAIYRILQESLTNVARHANASQVWISLETEDNNLILQVTDNGCGCDDADLAERQSLGIRGMRERAHSVSGTITIEGVAGEGTSVQVSVPLPMQPAPQSSAEETLKQMAQNGAGEAEPPHAKEETT